MEPQEKLGMVFFSFHYLIMEIATSLQGASLGLMTLGG